MNNCNQILEQYLKAIDNNSRIEKIDSGCILLTPFIHFNGEFINIYFEQLDSDTIKIHDNGDTLSELYLNGVDIFSNIGSKSHLLLNSILHKFNFENEGWSIQKKVNVNDMSNSIIDAVNCLKSIFDLLFLHQATSTNTFKTIVTKFLRTNDIVFSKDHKVNGKTIEHKIDYYVKPKNTKPPIYINAYSAKRTYDLAIKSSFAFQDLKNSGLEFEWIPIINPEDDWTEKSLNILRTYSTEVVDWGSKDFLIDKFLK